MIHLLTDEESVAHSEALILKVSEAMATTVRMHPGATIGALSQVLFLVNGQHWMCSTDAARARVKAKERLRGGAGEGSDP